MKSISNKEIEAATFKINPSVKVSAADDDKLLKAAKKYLAGNSVEEVAVELFRTNNEKIIQSIVDRAALIKSGKKLEPITNHRFKKHDDTEKRFKRINLS